MHVLFSKHQRNLISANICSDGLSRARRPVRAGTWDLEGTVFEVTLVPHLNAKLINHVWDFVFVSFFFCFHVCYKSKR